ncbi:hypothetical protein Acr_05g0002240 [Actinidia rufa]|uniref:Uncharacterized protein n=1 Tax=Actinidia rufa TaxID=165716 RepID=A0A7J0EJE6_9ERIC|nr:hypothetical protein Acr_05g0002240 [Actinidia rufa]
MRKSTITSSSKKGGPWRCGTWTPSPSCSTSTVNPSPPPSGPSTATSEAIVLNHFGPDTLREKLLPQIEQMIDSTLGIWSLQGSVPVKEAVATLVFDCTAKQMIGYDPKKIIG